MVVKDIYLCLEGNAAAQERLAGIDDLDLYGHRRAKRIIMYARLYFPRLQRIHQHLFDAERQFNDVKFRLFTTAPPSLSEVLDATGKVIHLLRAMEQEIVFNRNHLLRANILPKRYRATTDDELQQTSLAPNGALMNAP
jgi:hypothetical protein